MFIEILPPVKDFKGNLFWKVVQCPQAILTMNHRGRRLRTIRLNVKDKFSFDLDGHKFIVMRWEDLEDHFDRTAIYIQVPDVKRTKKGKKKSTELAPDLLAILENNDA